MKEKKKVVHLVEAFGGGIYTFINDIVRQTIDDFDITIVHGIRKQTPEDFKAQFHKDVTFIEVKEFTREINLKKEIKAFQEIKKIMKDIKPDIIHIHSSKAGILGRLAVNGNKVKMFYNPHSFSFLKKDDPKLKTFIYYAIEKFAAICNPKCKIIGCSEGEAEVARKINKNTICINNGIDVVDLKDKTKDLKEKEINFDNLSIVTIGRISNQKNPEVFQKLAETFPDISFTWIGDGELRSMLHAPNIDITGWKKREEVLKVLNENDIFILPSLWEGLPISLLEAMYMKKICVVSNCIGNKDVINHGHNGFMAETFEAYIDIINMIKKSNEKEMNKIKEQAKEDVKQIYNLKRMTEEYKKIYLGEH